MSGLVRGIGVRGAVALNTITMIGIGPLITIPLVLAQLAGPMALAGWIAGAIVALCDGLVWAELGSRYPGSGGTYVYLRETFGAQRLGRVLAFLFNWQFFLYAPFLLASGYIGFAQYAGYLVPAIAQSPLLAHLVAMGVGIVTIALLYRRITAIASLGTLLAAGAVLTLVLVIVAALPHADFARAFTLAGPMRFGWGFLAGLGGALYITLYDYVGYSDAALLGDECREPRRTIPVAIVVSILLVAILYIALQVGVLGVVPWQHLVGQSGAPPPPGAQFVASSVVATVWGSWPARIVTLLVLVTAFASVYGNLLGFSRVPFAAARDGAFLPAFGTLHPTKGFPHVSLLAIGALSLAACWFTLDQAIAILTAGIVLIQSIAQIAALFTLRARGERAPFRMWFFPLPAIVALAGWVLAFVYTGPFAITIGMAWLLVGLAVYLALASSRRYWPFAVKVGVTGAIAVALCWHPPIAMAAAGARQAQDDRYWHASAIAQDHGYPVLTVHGKPFFVYGAAFFYERVPRDLWRHSLLAYKAMGINTIDLYAIWNWHEPRDPATVTGSPFDFTGRTNPRRDLVGLMRLIDALGFKVVLRPGPVIRNEWRNGGYPAWLLDRPEYGMPLHDVLEGRYPATATLQNAHSDAAAEEWLHNPTHLHYAALWLRTVLRAVAPWKRDVIAIALDDDQGAYIDNDTWPGPHFRAYIDWLRSVVRSVVGPKLPLFINTYEMKVTAWAPVWAWGDWYQSDAYRIGDHDRANIDFSTGLLQTQPHRPVMIGEFQAGWLQGAGETRPRAADPTNTTLALHEFLRMGAHGIVNFPVQNTVYPAGWEVPWANWAYDWDAALKVDPPWLSPPPNESVNLRYWPTASFGVTIARYGTLLAQTHVVAPYAIAWMPSVYRARALTNRQFGQMAEQTTTELQSCSARGFSCDLVDLRFADRATLARYRRIVVPPLFAGVALNTKATLRIARLRGRHRIADSIAVLPDFHAVSGTPDATLFVSDDPRRGYAFADIANWSDTSMTTGPLSAQIAPKGILRHTAVTVPPRSALLVRLVRVERAPKKPIFIVRPNAEYYCPKNAFAFGDGFWPLHPPAHSNGPAAFRQDALEDGEGMIFLENRFLRLGFSPDAGARVATLMPAPFCALSHEPDYLEFATTIGLLRDGVLHAPPPSPRDYIAKFTHPFPAGTFNRRYACTIANGTVASVSCRYHAPDLPAGGGTFTRTLTLAPNAHTIEVTERLTLDNPDPSQRLVSISAFRAGAGSTIFAGAEHAFFIGQTLPLRAGNAFGLYDPALCTLLAVNWRPGSVQSGSVQEVDGAAILRLVMPAARDDEFALRLYPATNLARARAVFASLRTASS